ncbi:MAG TPA: MBL fold metallo-hydrolase [Beijerinckiaceae bacterium]
MRLHFHGAAGGVTGSCCLLETRRARVLVDCGMFQGSKTEKELNYRDFPFDPPQVDALLLTHAHIDHSGLVPKLAKAGFRGPVHATPATVDLCSIMLPDSGHVQEAEVAQLNRRNARRGAGAVVPIYTAEDAVACLDQFRACPLGAWREVAPGLRARFWNAGHLLGSASIEVEAEEDGRVTRVLFSGDVGPDEKLLQTRPEGPSGVDHIICESTYGDVDRPEATGAERLRLLSAAAQDAARRRGALLIPSFAVERTQELLADLVGLMESGGLPRAPIFIDSPLATRASEVFAAHRRDLDNGGALAAAMRAPMTRFTQSVEESKAIARITGFHVVIAASGMCEAGRIRHHLRNWLWRGDGTVLFVGYQAQGTLGRILLDGARRVRIMGEEVDVRAQIRRLDLYSGHADGPELARWVAARAPIAGRVFLNHGEPEALAGFAARLAPSLGPDAVVTPRLDETFELDGAVARRVGGGAPRVAPAAIARPDWHNDLSSLVLDIDAAVRAQADERGRAALIRRLRRALTGEAR